MTVLAFGGYLAYLAIMSYWLLTRGQPIYE